MQAFTTATTTQRNYPFQGLKSRPRGVETKGELEPVERSDSLRKHGLPVKVRPGTEVDKVELD